MFLFNLIARSFSGSGSSTNPFALSSSVSFFIFKFLIPFRTFPSFTFGISSFKISFTLSSFAALSFFCRFVFIFSNFSTVCLLFSLASNLTFSLYNSFSSFFVFTFSSKMFLFSSAFLNFSFSCATSFSAAFSLRLRETVFSFICDSMLFIFSLITSTAFLAALNFSSITSLSAIAFVSAAVASRKSLLGCLPAELGHPGLSATSAAAFSFAALTSRSAFSA